MQEEIYPYFKGRRPIEIELIFSIYAEYMSATSLNQINDSIQFGFEKIESFNKWANLIRFAN